MGFFPDEFHYANKWVNHLIKNFFAMLYLPYEEILNYMNKIYTEMDSKNHELYYGELIENFHFLSLLSFEMFSKIIQNFLFNLKHFLNNLKSKIINTKEEIDVKLENFACLMPKKIKGKKKINGVKVITKIDFKARAGMKKCQQLRRFFGFDDYNAPKSITKVKFFKLIFNVFTIFE